MPEGDTIHRHALIFRARFVGKRLRAVLRGGVAEPRYAGLVLASAEALGKHLVLAFADGEVEKMRIRVHLGIAGNWRFGPRAEHDEYAQRRSPLLLDFEDVLARVVKPKQVVLEPIALADLLPTARLGPDLLGAEPDYAEILRRARRPEHAAGPLGELLLHQGVAAGIGNVYKSELCFLHGLHPFLRVDEVTDEQLERVYRDATRLLAANLGPWRRTTTADRSRGELPANGRGRFWVYERKGLPCYRCGTRIERRAQGREVRSTFYCARCQAP